MFRQLFDQASSTYSYLLADEKTRDAVLIDPVFEQYERDAALVRELGLRLHATLETHVHADHVTAAWLFRARMGSRIVLSKRSGAENADRYVDEGDWVEVGREALEVRATPGHTSGCLTYVTRDQSMAFTGDALLIRGAGRTDFQQGDARTLFRSVRERIFTLPGSCAIFPGHDYRGRTSSSVAEELLHNPRLGGDRSESDFVGLMSNLHLAHPKQIAVAVPSNLKCGKPDHELPEDSAEWPARRSYAGIQEIDPEWVHENRDRVHVVDVREPFELQGELGRIEGVRNVPLGQLKEELSSLPTDKPIVFVCRSGGRSAQGVALADAAKLRTANLSGGMIRWRAARLPVEGGGG